MLLSIHAGIFNKYIYTRLALDVEVPGEFNDINRDIDDGE